MITVVVVVVVVVVVFSFVQAVFLRFQAFGEFFLLLRMNNERFMVPEILFHPCDIGIQQMGIPEAVVLAIAACEESSHPWLYRYITII